MKWFLGMVACLVAIQMSLCQASESPHSNLQICDKTTLAELTPEPDKPVVVLQIDLFEHLYLTEAPMPQEVAAVHVKHRERWTGGGYGRRSKTYSRAYASTPASVPRFTVGFSVGRPAGCANGSCRR